MILLYLLIWAGPRVQDESEILKEDIFHRPISGLDQNSTPSMKPNQSTSLAPLSPLGGEGGDPAKRESRVRGFNRHPTV
jgi:hypothetical protein